MKSPFDVAKQIVSKDVPWDEELSSSWNTYMINRALSMNPDNIEVVNHTQRYFNIPDKNTYYVYLELLAKNSRYFPYIKAKTNITKTKPEKEYTLTKIKKSGNVK